MANYPSCAWFSNGEVGPPMEHQKTGSSSKVFYPGGTVEYDAAQTMPDKLLGLIEECSFLRECFRRSLQIALPFPIITHSNVKEFRQDNGMKRPSIMILSCLDMDRDSCANALDELLEIEPRTPVIVLGQKSQFLNVAIGHGAKGYIPLTMEFEVVVEAVRVVLAGGTYMPMDLRVRPNFTRAGKRALGWAYTPRAFGCSRNTAREIK
jgi:DNA-binding NarL/FixJ family response regulator